MKIQAPLLAVALSIVALGGVDEARAVSAAGATGTGGGAGGTAGPEPLAAFFAVLAEIEDGAVGQPGRIARIAWWGDSAIVSDGYTGRVRSRLQARFGDAGPGFSLAATTFPGYLRDGMRLKRHGWETDNIIQGSLKSKRYGYGGIQARAWGGASSTFDSRDTPWDRVEVFYRAFPKAGTLQIFADGAGRATAEHDERADPPSDRVWRWRAPAGGVTKVRVRAGGKGLTVLYGVALERGERGLVLDSLGLLGMRARRWLKVDAAHLADQVAARHPALLVVNFGGNERVDPGLSVTGHRREIAEVVRLFKQGAPEASCLIVGPIAHGDHGKWRLDPALEVINTAQREAAAEVGCAFLDTVALMGGDDAIRTFRKKKLIGGDLAHLNSRGHVAVGDLIADWLLARYDAWRTSRG